jgi:diguanylate cyclase (GGDEF)-like protein
LLKFLFNPPAEMSRKRYLRMAVVTVTLLSVAASLLTTLIVESLTAQPALEQSGLVAVIVPLLVVPPLAYWHHNVLYKLEESKRQILELSRTDELTGLYNRRFFFELAEEHKALAQRQGYPLSLLVLDLDYFKYINDRYGHQTGDQVLCFIARSLGDIVRGSDILARYGGEEFVLLMPQTNGQEAFSLCQRIRRQLALVQARQAELPSVTLSIGAACSEQYGYQLDTLLAEADKALYQAKVGGRDTCILAGVSPSNSNQ